MIRALPVLSLLIACGSTATTAPAATVQSERSLGAPLGCPEHPETAAAPEPEETDTVLELSRMIVGCEGTTEEQARARDLSPACERTLASLLLSCGQADLEALRAQDRVSDRCEAAIRASFRPASGPRWVILRVERDAGGLLLTVADTGGEPEVATVELVVEGEAGVVAATDGPAPTQAKAIANVLDYSGSMSDAEVDQSVALFDGLWSSAATDDAAGEVLLFSSDVVRELPFVAERATLREALERNDAMPRSSTALLDAIGHGVADLAERPEPIKLVVVATDGAENSSRCFDQPSLVSFARSHGVRVVFWGNLLASQGEMRVIAEATGGTFFYGSDPEDARASMARFIGALAAPRRLQVTDPSAAEATEVCVGGSRGRACAPVP